MTAVCCNMIVAMCGMQRSASTWSYNVCREILQRAGLKIDPSSGQYSPEDLAEKASEGAAPNTALLLRSHWPHPTMIDRLKKGEIRIVYTVRDPRDALASVMYTFENNFKNAVRDLERSLSFMDHLISNGGALLLRYPDIIRSPDRVISETADYLQTPITEDKIQYIAEKLSRDKLKKRAENLNPDKQKVFEGFSYDAETLLLNNHIRSENPSRWQEQLSRSQGRFLTWYWRNRLDWLGTPTTHSEMGSWFSWPGRLCYLGRLRLWEQSY